MIRSWSKQHFANDMVFAYAAKFLKKEKVHYIQNFSGIENYSVR